jgi:hypothetical protein
LEMARYDHLRTIAFRLSPDLTTLPHRCNRLVFPERWKTPLRELQAEILNRDPNQTNIPINMLNRALGALVPDLIKIEYGAAKSGERPWLYSSRRVDPEHLMLIIRAWVRLEFAKAGHDRIERVLEELHPGDLHWREEDIDLAAWRTAANGTAEAVRGDSFLLLPDLLASWISQPNFALEYGPAMLQMRRAPTLGYQNGVELISWLPLGIENEQPHSITLKLTTQTVPFQPYPVVYVEIGIRRWMSPGMRPPGGERTSVYVLTQVPWLRGLHESQSFHVASIRWGRPTGEKDAKGSDVFPLIWADQLTEMLDQLHPQRPFPDPMQLLNDPIGGMNLQGSPSAAVAFREKFNMPHGVGPGLMIPDRQLLAEQLEALFAPRLQFTERPERAMFRASSRSNPLFEKTRDSDGNIIPEVHARVTSERRDLIRRASGDQFTIAVRYQSPEIQQALITAICELLGVDQPAALPATITTPELTIHLNAQLLGAIGSALQLDAEIKSKPDQWRSALDGRIDQIKKVVPQADRGTLALIELAHNDGFGDRQDPKLALRLGFARQGYVSQFLVPVNEKDKETLLSNRAASSVLDGLRQLGVCPPLPQIDGLPQPLNIVGVWLIKPDKTRGQRRAQVALPVFVHLSTETHEIRMTAPGFGEKWLLYDQALLKIGRGEFKGYDRDRDSLPYIRHVLMSDVLPQGNTLLLCDTHNLRLIWPWLQNPKLTLDQIMFGDEAPQEMSRWPGLRIVRVRHGQSETPEWYAQRPDGEGFTEGVFRMGNRIFASTYNKPAQQRKLSPSLSKAGPWTMRSGKTRDAGPETYAWNPGLYELTVAYLQPQDQGRAELWAALAHELRSVAAQYNDAMALPLPLHLTKLADEYIVHQQNEDDFEVDTGS